MRDWGEKLFFAEVFEITFLDKDMQMITCKTPFYVLITTRYFAKERISHGKFRKGGT